jgi:hypothetical protein
MRHPPCGPRDAAEGLYAVELSYFATFLFYFTTVPRGTLAPAATVGRGDLPLSLERNYLS